MKFKSRLKPSFNLIDLTPLVDVIFLLLVFFLITSDILPLKSLNVENPQLNRDTLPLTTQLIVVMDAQQVIYVGSKNDIVDFGSIKEHLNREIQFLKSKHRGTQPTIVLSVDKRVDYGAFLRLFSEVQQCGSTVRLSYKPT
jgi:biopolymer transport protein ExbD